MEQKKFKWWHAMLVLLAANLVSAIPAGIYGEAAFYNNFNQPRAAPPDWLFAPVWLFLNITSAWALYIVANLPKTSKGRTAFIWLEAIGWVLFAMFSLVYFGLKSPVLGALDTVLGLLVAATNLWFGFRVHKLAGFFILLRVLWLLLASYVSAYMAFNNADPLMGVG